MVCKFYTAVVQVMNCDCQIQEQQEPVLQYVVTLLRGSIYICNYDLHPQLVQIQNQPSAQNVALNPKPSLYFKLCFFSSTKNFLDPNRNRRRRPNVSVSR